MTRWRWLVFIFSTLVVVSGISCFLLEKRWVGALTPAAKLPLYTLLGTSLSFALTFSVVDLINQSSCGPRAVALVQTSKQVYVVAACSLAMGAIFGFSFGMLDVEDDGRLDRRFDEDQAINGAIGAVVGILMGGANQYLR
eukprot:CAMPEP_0113711348 /NCGR_PEP_ID=MMETSP0038_2-20120614/30702_1 /TAXON_ID=2898 /ORGANISM="Cryptomonas paramecium" /LENGTH=139 /DNA_ID=CAMNT_0000637585 /DNA_START=201 /DNA_END=616 /DNA_ORIENTATION=- /assembly_acc=CAM_ASM_000170